MIDCEKLKLAYELSKKLPFKHYALHFNFGNGLYKNHYILYYEDSEGFTNEYEFKHEEIDELIEKLEGLTEPEPKYQPKYKVGQTVWRVNDEYLPCSLVIKKIDTKSQGSAIYRDEDNDTWLEDELYPTKLYPTKQSLVHAQIKYWENMLENRIQPAPCVGNIPIEKIQAAVDSVRAARNECEHQDDGNCYLSNPPQTKCWKCGEFYR
jgi:hypothetical protein